MRKIVLAAALLLAGCSQPETKPRPSAGSPSTSDLELTVKNEAVEPRTVWVESYDEGPLGAPVKITEIGTLESHQSATKTVPVPTKGSYRVIAAEPTGDPGDRRVVYMGNVIPLRSSEAAERITR